MLMFGILTIIGIAVYNEINQNNIVEEVQDFVSNITVSSEIVSEKIETPEIKESYVNTLLESSNENTSEEVNYPNIELNKHFYNQLDEYSKIIYNAMDKNKENMKTGTYEIDLGTEFSALLSKENGEDLLGKYYQSAIEAYIYDNPDIFYLEPSNMCLNIETTTRGRKTTYRVFINSGNSENYLSKEFPNKEVIDSALIEIEKVKSYFIQNKKLDTYSNIKLVHDYLVESIEYEQTTSQDNIYNIYGALINKKCVCEGYAKAFKYLMDALNIPCVIIIGEATNSDGQTENHAWNYAKIDGDWYAVDCTWDDPIIIGVGKASNISKYKYFLKGEGEFNETHIPNGQFTEKGKIFEYPTLSVSNYK